MKNIKVVVAVIKTKDNDGNTVILATQKGYGDIKAAWEFPGGKVEDGETIKDALRREIKEELETEVFIEDLIGTVEHDYPTFHISMDCYWCETAESTVILREHVASKWLKKDELDSVYWLPANVKILDKIKEQM